MPDNSTIFVFPRSPAELKTLPPRRPASEILCKDKPVELDMGEASREEGFRLYGCR